MIYVNIKRFTTTTTTATTTTTNNNTLDKSVIILNLILSQRFSNFSNYPLVLDLEKD